MRTQAQNCLPHSTKRTNKMIDELKNIIVFLEENEQYGDDWSKEIAVLQKIALAEREDLNPIVGVDANDNDIYLSDKEQGEE